MDVVIDVRERSSAVPALLEGRGHTCRFKTLQAGDYVVAGRVLVERKTSMDFSKSLYDGRLFRQTSRLVRSPLRVALLIEGVRPVRVGRPQLLGALVTLGLVFQLPVLRAQGPEESAWLLENIGKQATRSVGRGLASRVPAPFDHAAAPLHLLALLPHVGPSRAACLLARFETLEGVFSASAVELMAVPGVGPKTADAIRTFLTKRHRPVTSQQPQPRSEC